MVSSRSIEPTCFMQEVKDPNWSVAMATKFDALFHNETWSLVPCTPSINVMGSKWVCWLKLVSMILLNIIKLVLWHKISVNNQVLTTVTLLI